MCANSYPRGVDHAEKGRAQPRSVPGVWDLLHKEDRKIAAMFDDLKRSTAFFKLAAWQSQGLVSDSDLALFTEETQDAVKAINEYARER